MKIGKVSNAVLNRSVLKYTEKGREGILASYPGVGNDASVFKAQKGQLVVSTDCGIEPVYTIYLRRAESRVRRSSVLFCLKAAARYA